MTTTEAKPTLKLDESKRDWLKTMGNALGVRLGGNVATPSPVVSSIAAKAAPSQPAAPVAPSRPVAPGQLGMKPRTVVVTVTDRMTKTAVPNADVSVGVERGKTNAQGVATLTLPPSDYNFSVTASLYTTASGILQVTLDPQTALAVVLKPSRTTLTLTASPPKESHLEQDIVFTATVDIGNSKSGPQGTIEFAATYYGKRISLAKVDVKDWKASYTWYLQPVGTCLFDATFKPSSPSTGFQETVSNLLQYTVQARSQQETDTAKKEYEQALQETKPIIDQGRNVAKTAPALEAGFKRVLQEQDEIENLAKNGNYRHAKEKELFLKNTTGPEFLAAADQYIKAVDRYEGCMVTARDFNELSDARKSLLAQRKNLDKYTNWGNSWWSTEKEAKVLFDLADKYRKVSDEKQKVYNDKGDKITKALDAVNPNDHAKLQEVARNIVANDLKNDADIKYLPADVRNRLVEELQRNHSPANMKVVQRIYSVRTLDPEFEKEDRKNRDKLIALLQNDPEMAKARKNWSDMDGNQKFAVMKKIVEYHAKVYNSAKAAGVPDFQVVGSSRGREKEDGKSSMTGGEYSPGTGLLWINTNEESPAMKDFDQAIDFAVHEAGHRYQNVLRAQVDKPGLQKGDPRYNQAKAFKMNTGPTYFKTPAVSERTYENQPKETHSRLSALTVQQAGIGK